MKNPYWKGVARWHSFRGQEAQSHAILKAMQPKVKPLNKILFEQNKVQLLKEADEALKQQEEEKNHASNTGKP